jgi:DNA-binding response OmpR family regulator
VLVVTEDGTLASACRGVLEQAGYEVTHASHSGHALLECLSGHRADVLLAEWSMPDGSGPALAERLRRYFPDMQAIYYASPGTSPGAGNVLARPFSPDALLARIRASLDS